MILLAPAISLSQTKDGFGLSNDKEENVEMLSSGEAKLKLGADPHQTPSRLRQPSRSIAPEDFSCSGAVRKRLRKQRK